MNFHYVTSAVLIVLSLFAGSLIQSLLESSIPASIYGLLILFLALASGAVKPHWVQPSASLLIKYMIVLFVPVSVGLMNYFEVLIENAWIILASTVGGSIIVLVLMAVILQKILPEDKR